MSYEHSSQVTEVPSAIEQAVANFGLELETFGTVQENFFGSLNY